MGVELLMALSLLEIAGGIIVIFIVVTIFCYLCIKDDVNTKITEEEAEWERIERSSAYDRKHPSESSTSHRRSFPYQKRIPKKKPISGVAHAISEVKKPSSQKEETVKALRGGEFIGNRMRFKVKVLNDSPFIISDVTVFLISYPKEALRLASKDNDVQYPKIEPGGFRSPTFDFLPTQDCVRGEVIAGVSYIDMRGQPHVLNTKPFVIRSVCDLLLPDQIQPDEFTAKLKDLHCGELVVKVQEWTPEEMHEKSLRIVEDANFYEVKSSFDIQDGVV